MKPEKEFDKILKQRIEESESEFAFDESNWQKASKLIDAERGAAGYKDNKRFLLVGAIFLILGSVGFFSYKYINSVGNGEISSNAGNNSVVNQNSNNVSLKGSSEKLLAGNSPVNIETPGMTDNENLSASAAITENKSSMSNTAETRSAEHAGNSTFNANKSIAIKGKYNSGKKAGNNSSIAGTSSGNNNSYTAYTGKTSDLTANNIGQNISQADVSGAETETAGSNMYENLFLKTKITKIPTHNLDGDIRKTSYDFIRIYDHDYFTSRRRKTYYLDAEAGTAYLLGWNAPKGKDAKGFNAYAGLNFGFHIKKKISASVGAQVYNISNIQQPFYTGSNVSYDFGSNGTYTTIATNSLLYFAVPVKINFAIDKRNTIGIGVNTAFLFNGQNTVETFNMADGVRSNVTSLKNTGYYEGTNTTNIMVTAFYSRAITRRVKLNGELMYGLSDVYKNTSSYSTKENSMGVRLGMQYTLFDK